MRTALVTLFPEMTQAALAAGVLGRAVRDGRLACALVNPRDHADGPHHKVDDRPFGGGPGMVMSVAPLRRAVAAARACVAPGVPVILLSPQGEAFDQRLAVRFAASPGFILVAARYEGVDERFVATTVDRELSIGDFVLSGGELAALVVLDAVARLLPGVLGNAESAARDSHADGLLEHPQYTRPARCDGLQAPDVLLSGNHGAVARWRRQEALARTWQRRPELLVDRPLDSADRALLRERFAEGLAPPRPGQA